MIRPRAVAHVLLALAACGGPALAQATPAPPPGLEDLAGRWTNASSPAIAALEIRVTGSTVTIHAWARCEASDCDWGEVQAEVYGASDPGDWRAPALSAVFAKDAAESRIIVSPGSAGRLSVEMLTRFHEGAGRNSIARASLFREGSPAARSQSSVGPLPLRVGGRINAPTKVKNVNPRYPADAAQNRIQGVVILQCTIDREGRVSDTEVLQGPPELINAAITAVRQWRYTRLPWTGSRCP